MVEALVFVIPLLSISIFAMVQVSLIVIDSLIANETVFSAARAAVVAQSSNEDKNAKEAAIYILASDSSPNNLTYFNTTTSKETAAESDPVSDYQGIPIQTLETKIGYGVHLMFSNIIQPFSGSIYTADATARMIKSPDSDYYNKSFPGASEW